MSATPVEELFAAMMATNGRVLVQNYDRGPPLGTLNTRGAIVQKWRGLVGTTDGAHGYKKYAYDDLLALRSPPHVREATVAVWKAAPASEHGK